jgi:uncharacterized protein
MTCGREATVAEQFVHGERSGGAPPELSELMRRIQFFYEPTEVWLFGSRATGKARSTSDWDLLVVVDDAAADAALDPEVAWRLQRGSGVHADVVAYRQSEFKAEAKVRNTLAHEVLYHGGRRIHAIAV